MIHRSRFQSSGVSRVHLALAVTDLDRSLRFYRAFLGLAPTKLRPDYAKFEATEPSVNLTLNLARSLDPDGRQAAQGGVAHFGIELPSGAAVEDWLARIRSAGLDAEVESGTTCCYSVQDKFWCVDPDGHRWEVFVVTQADAESRSGDAACCPASSAGECC